MSDISKHRRELETFSFLAYRLAVARQKHPEFASSDVEAWEVIREEMLELINAINYESEDRRIDEAVDVAVTAIRFILGEHKQK